MKMIWRILIVVGNLLLAPIMFVITFVGINVRHVIRFIRDETVLTYGELLCAYFSGIKDSWYMNAEFLETGDIEVFADIFN